jgi:hypothetical protein
MAGPDHHREAERLVTQTRDAVQASAPESSRRYAQTVAEPRYAPCPRSPPQPK